MKEEKSEKKKLRVMSKKKRKENKKILNRYTISVCTVSKLKGYCSILQKFDTFNTFDKAPFFVFSVSNAKCQIL